jgi:hypothetical protein
MVSAICYSARERQPVNPVMNEKKTLLLAALLSLCVTTVHAQPGGPPPGPRFGSEMTKIFGENTAFSANLEFRMSRGGTADPMTVPGKLAYLTGQSRFEMELTAMKGAQLPPQAAAQMQQMGMDKMVIVARPDKKLSYIMYPGLLAYVENPIPASEVAQPAEDYQVQTTELGKETLDGHACVKNKTVVTGKDGKPHEFTVWNATDLKQFPLKIETNQDGNNVTMLFKDVKLAKPDAAQFDPPADYKKYDSMMAMMQQEMMKRLGGGGLMPH